MKRLPQSLSVSAAAILAVLAGVLLVGPSARADLTEGRDYALMPQQKAAAPAAKGKTEVIQFFSYACPHCANMHPFIDKWVATLPANVEVVRVPVSFGRREWGALSRAYYALQNLGELQRLDAALFDSLHVKGESNFSEDNLAAWAAKQGLDGEKFRKEYNSERVTKAVMNAETLSRDLAIESIPKVIVARRYKVEAKDAKTYDDFFAVARRIVDKAAKEQSAKR